MITQAGEIQRICERDISPDFRLNLVRMLALAYKESLVEMLEEFDSSEVHDLLPHYRRARIEGGLRGLCRRHDAESEARTNSHGGAYHTVMRMGCVVLTESAAAEAGGRRVPQKAIFRDNYAAGDQLSLFGDNSVVNPEQDGVYGLIVHGPRDCYAPAPEFAFLGFPRRNGKSYITRVSLATELQQVLASDPSIEHISPELALRLRDVRRVETGTGGDDGNGNDE